MKGGRCRFLSRDVALPNLGLKRFSVLTLKPETQHNVLAGEKQWWLELVGSRGRGEKWSDSGQIFCG